MITTTFPTAAIARWLLLLRDGFALCLIAITLSASFAACAGASESRMPLLMPDDFSDLHLVAWRVEPGKNDTNNPLIEGAMPWDRGGVGIHGSVFKDPIAGRWRAYLVCTPAEESPEKQPENQGKPWASENAAHRRVCLFESQDGVKWSRPKLANVPFGEHKTTNILFDVTDGVSAYSSILVDPRNQDSPYEMFVLRESWGAVKGKASKGNGYYRYRSKDGYRWEPTGEFINDPMRGDLCFFYRDTEGGPEGGYVAYYRLGGPRKDTDHVPVYEDFPRRSCFRAVSRDGKKWVRDPLMLLTADERDHRDTQYQECVPLRVPGGYLGFVTMYWPLTQTLNLRLAASRDGRQWWFPDRRPCLDNAPLGDFGGGMIWQSQYPIVEDGKLHVYYGGTEGPHRQIHDTRAPSKAIGYQEKVIDHGAHFLPFNSALCRATWRVDRLYALASAAGGPTVGSAVTKPRPLGGKKLHVNVVTRTAKGPGGEDGELRVELLDVAGKPIPGFTREDCRPIKGDETALAVQWRKGDAAPVEAKQAKFYLKRAFLYGFRFVDGPKEGPRPTAVELRPYTWKGPYADMRAKFATKHDTGLCLDVRAPWMADGERLILRTSEIVGDDEGYFYDDHFPTQEQNGRGKGYKHKAFGWDLREASPVVKADCVVPGKGRFRLKLHAMQDCVDIELAVRNDSRRVMEYVDWYFCVVGFEAPTLADATLERTFIYDGQRLRSLAELSGKGKGEEMFAVAGAGGFIPPLHRGYPRGKIVAKEPIVLVEDIFGMHTAALTFERAHSIFSSVGNRCFHVDPFFGLHLKPGEERTVRGKLYLCRGSAVETLDRFQREKR
jgi:hypothetical protein